MGLLDWHRHGELVDTAYRWTLGEMARLARERHPALAQVR
jgi:hypothetical protein